MLAGEHEACSASLWAALPAELLIAVVVLAAPHARSLPELLAPSRVCRSWALAYRSDELWRALHSALSLPAGAGGGDARPPPSWREKVASATLGLSLLDCGAGPGAIELPLAEAFPPEARTLQNSVSTPGVGGHVCVLSRGRLAVIHLPSLHGGRGVTSALHSTCADKLTQRTVVPWAGASVAVTACGSHASRNVSVVEITPLSCCGDSFGPHAGVPALRLEDKDGEVVALDAAALTDGPHAGQLLLAAAVKNVSAFVVKAHLLSAEAGAVSVVWTRKLQMGNYLADTPLLRVDPRSGDVVITAKASLMRWPALQAAASTHAKQLRQCKVIARGRIWALTLLGDGGVCVACDCASKGTLAMLLPVREGARAGELPDPAYAIELRRDGEPLWPRGIGRAALGALVVTAADGDVELFHTRSGRYLGRVFTSPVHGRYYWRAVTAVPAACCAAAPGLVSWRTGQTGGAQLLLHPHQRDGFAPAAAEHAVGPAPEAAHADRAAPTAVTSRAGWC